jgi:hypothetical protein
MRSPAELICMRPVGIRRFGFISRCAECTRRDAAEEAAGGSAVGVSLPEEQVQAGMMAARTRAIRGKKVRIRGLL